MPKKMNINPKIAYCKSQMSVLPPSPSKVKKIV